MYVIYNGSRNTLKKFSLNIVFHELKTKSGRLCPNEETCTFALFEELVGQLSEVSETTSAALMNNVKQFRNNRDHELEQCQGILPARPY
jgi:hypothetical protein